jgi:hypothetical protein
MPNPTFEEIKSNPAYYGMSEAKLRAAYDAKYGRAAAAAPAAAPGMLERIKNFATSKPVMMTAAGLAALPLTGGMSLPATMLAEGGIGALSGLASDALNGRTDTPGEMATDAALGAAGPVAGRALSAAGRGLAYVGESLPRSIRGLIGFGGLATGHPGALGLEAATNPRLAPAALQKVGGVYTSAVEKLRGLAGNPLVENAAESAVPKRFPLNARGRGLTQEVPYRMTEPVTESVQPTRAGVRNLVNETKAASNRIDPTNVINDVIRSGPTMDRMYAQANPIFRDMQLKGAWGERGFNEAVDAMNRPLSVVGEQSARQVPPSMAAIDALIAKSGVNGVPLQPVASHAAEAAAPTVARAARPAADYIHPADTTGGAFGFDSLPQISESELARLQSLFNRVGAR